MYRRRPLVALTTLCVAVAMTGAPVASAQPPVAPPGAEVSDLPTLSELPPVSELPALPSDEEDEETEVEDDTSESDRSGVQTAALVLAVGALVAGGLGLALVTRRGRAEE